MTTLWTSLHIACFLTYLYLSFFILFKNPRSQLNRAACLLSCCVTLWAFGIIFIHNPGTSKSMVVTVSNFISIGWIGFASCLLWFSLAFSGRRDLLRSKPLVLATFLVPAFFYYQQISHLSLIADYRLQSYGWTPLWNKSPLVWLFILYVLCSAGTALLMIARYAKKRRSYVDAMQARLFLVAGFIFLFIAISTGLVLPLLDILVIPSLSTVGALVWAIAVIIAMNRYEFLTITPEIAAEQIISKMAECLILVDSRGNILSVNNATEMLLGYDGDELRGKPFAMLFPKERFPMDMLIKGKNAIDLTDHDCICTAHGDNPIPVSISYSVLKGTSRTVKGFICIMRDMTKYREAEHELEQARLELEDTVRERTAALAETNRALRVEIREHREAEYALRVSEEKYRTILENMEDGYFEVDTAGRFTFFNSALLRRLGYTADEFTGMSYKDIMDEENARRIYKTFNRAYTMKTPGRTLEYEFLTKEGETKIVETPVSLIRDATGVITGFRGLARDVTEQKHLTMRLQRAQKMEAIGTLAGGVAHDLNNILSGIVNYPELILMDLPPDSPMRDSVLAIRDSGERAASVVQDLLTLARRGVTVSKVINLNTIVSDYLKSPEHERLIHMNPRITIRTRLAGNLPNITGSPTHLSKSLMNLVSNGMDSMPDGGDIVISTKYQYIDRPIGNYDQVEEGNYAVMRVHDTGSGISHEDMDKIFEPFYTKKVMGKSGTGLGLAVVWGTVKDHNGYIDVRSIEGEGTIFSLYFHVSSEQIVTDISTLSLKDLMGKGEFILVVDDIQEQRDIATAILQQLNYSVMAVAGGKEAVEYMKHHRADLLLIDMIMAPGIDGLETYKKILKIHPEQKALITSGFSETKRIAAALKRGAGQYIKKPYTIEQIGRAIKDELLKGESLKLSN